MGSVSKMSGRVFSSKDAASDKSVCFGTNSCFVTFTHKNLHVKNCMDLFWNSFLVKVVGPSMLTQMQSLSPLVSTTLRANFTPTLSSVCTKTCAESLVTTGLPARMSFNGSLDVFTRVHM